MQPGDVLVRNTVGSGEFVKPGPGNRCRRDPDVVAVQQQPAIDELEWTRRIDRQRSPAATEHDVTVIAGTGAGRPAHGRRDPYTGDTDADSYIEVDPRWWRGCGGHHAHHI
jgi:hypothetical protein